MATNDKQAAKADNADVQKQIDAVNEQGFYGQKVDPTPNENYTLAGVVAGKPTPETDAKAAASAAQAQRDIAAEASA